MERKREEKKKKIYREYIDKIYTIYNMNKISRRR